MSPQGNIEIVDREGWRQVYPLEKPIVYIGSHPGNDLVLEEERGRGVASLHAQLIAAGKNGDGYQLINLADAEIWLDPEGSQTLGPRSATQVTPNSTFIMGEFTLTFRAEGGDGATTGTTTSARPGGTTSSGGSPSIGLSLYMSETTLVPGRSLDGVVTIRNQGEQSGVQFEVDLEGLDDDCYDIEPGPLLSTGAEKEVLFRLYHQNYKPLAGDCRITVRAIAPNAYPAEVATVSKTIQVRPFFRHRLQIYRPEETEPELTGEAALQAGSEADQAPSGRPARKSGLSRTAAGGENIWSSAGQESPSPARPETAVALRAKTGPAAEPPPETDEDAADWWAEPPPQSGPPPQALPPQAAPPPAQAAAASGAEDDETADWWATTPTGETASAAAPAEAEAASAEPPPIEAESGDDWWDTPTPAASEEQPPPAESRPEPPPAPPAEIQVEPVETRDAAADAWPLEPETSDEAGPVEMETGASPAASPPHQQETEASDAEWWTGAATGAAVGATAATVAASGERSRETPSETVPPAASQADPEVQAGAAEIDQTGPQSEAASSSTQSQSSAEASPPPPPPSKPAETEAQEEDRVRFPVMDPAGEAPQSESPASPPVPPAPDADETPLVRAATAPAAEESGPAEAGKVETAEAPAEPPAPSLGGQEPPPAPPEPPVRAEVERLQAEMDASFEASQQQFSQVEEQMDDWSEPAAEPGPPESLPGPVKPEETAETSPEPASSPPQKPPVKRMQAAPPAPAETAPPAKVSEEASQWFSEDFEPPPPPARSSVSEEATDAEETEDQAKPGVKKLKAGDAALTQAQQRSELEKQAEEEDWWKTKLANYREWREKTRN